jgi:hypothetical protein
MPQILLHKPYPNLNVLLLWRECLLEFYVFFRPMGSPTVRFDGLYFGPFVLCIVSTFNFSANFVFHFIFLYILKIFVT